MKLGLGMVLGGVVAVWVAGNAPAMAAEEKLDDVLQKAVLAYDQGDFNTATSHYERAVSNGLTNGHVFYNLGHAYYKAGEFGKAMAAFLAARRLLPRNPDVKANLKFLQGKLTDQLQLHNSASIGRTLLFWTRYFTPLELWRAAMLCLAMICFGLGYVVVKSKPAVVRKVLYGALVLPVLLVFAALSTSALAEKWGAITIAKAQIRSGPALQNTVLFELSEGAPFMLADRSGEWLQIRLSDGKKGWVKTTSAQVY